MTASEYTFFQRMQAIAVLHAIFMLLGSIAEGFFGFSFIAFWVDSWSVKGGILVFFWFISPYFLRMFKARSE